MSAPKQVDNIDRLISTLKIIKKYHEIHNNIRDTINKVNLLINFLRKPGLSSGYHLTFEVVETIASKNPIGAFIFTAYAAHFEVLSKAINAFDSYMPLINAIEDYYKGCKKLEETKNSFIKNAKYNLNVHGQGIISYHLMNAKVFSGLPKNLLYDHLNSMHIHVNNLINAIDYFLWYYVRVNDRLADFERAIENFEPPKDIIQNIAQNGTKNTLKKSKYRIRKDNIGNPGDIREMIKLRNNWANWINLPSYDKNTYLNNQINEFGNKKVHLNL